MLFQNCPPLFHLQSPFLKYINVPLYGLEATTCFFLQVAHPFISPFYFSINLLYPPPGIPFKVRYRLPSVIDFCAIAKN